MCLAVPGKIVSVTADESILRKARVSFGGILKEVSLAYTPEAKPGDYVMVHAGFAISTVDLKEAEKVFESLKEIDGLGELQT